MLSLGYIYEKQKVDITLFALLIAVYVAITVSLSPIIWTNSI